MSSLLFLTCFSGEISRVETCFASGLAVKHPIAVKNSLETSLVVNHVKNVDTTMYIHGFSSLKAISPTSRKPIVKTIDSKAL